jgi:uncharacterized membrane protein YeiH
VQDEAFRVPIYFEYAATLAWAMSGAVVGVRKQYDLTGVFVIALLSSSGGGLIRDAMFLQRTPAFLVSPVYLPLVAGSTLLIALFSGPLTRLLKADTVKKLVDVIDALGTPAFAVVGMQFAMERQIPLLGVLFIGLVNGTAGGLLRDVVVREVPSLLRPGQFVSLALVIVCGLFLILTQRYDFSPTNAAWWTVGAFFVIRVVAVRFNWRTRPVASGSLPLDIGGRNAHPSDDDDNPIG